VFPILRLTLSVLYFMGPPFSVRIAGLRALLQMVRCNDVHRTASFLSLVAPAVLSNLPPDFHHLLER